MICVPPHTKKTLNTHVIILIDSIVDDHRHSLGILIASKQHHFYSQVKWVVWDKTPTKVELGAGVYKDDNRLPWTLPSVKEVRNLSYRECSQIH